MTAPQSSLPGMPTLEVSDIRFGTFYPNVNVLIRVSDVTSSLSFILNHYNFSCIFCNLFVYCQLITVYFTFYTLSVCFDIYKFILLTAHSRRGDLEILGYNMTHWLCSRLPWEDNLQDCNYVFKQKRAFMENIPSLISQCFPETEPPGKFLLLRLQHSSYLLALLVHHQISDLSLIYKCYFSIQKGKLFRQAILRVFQHTSEIFNF